ncbi:hypothetical protein F5141DRAFT_1065509 [Pisolithus sp. B1]|nr:hypothetical protein F5141DRAFT_1065509 [Pisolithus sp. B1]
MILLKVVKMENMHVKTTLDSYQVEANQEGGVQAIKYHIVAEVQKEGDIQSKLLHELLAFGSDPICDQLQGSLLLPYFGVVVHKSLHIHPPMTDFIHIICCNANEMVPTSQADDTELTDMGVIWACAHYADMVPCRRQLSGHEGVSSTVTLGNSHLYLLPLDLYAHEILLDTNTGKSERLVWWYEMLLTVDRECWFRNMTEEFFTRRSPLYKAVGQLGR